PAGTYEVEAVAPASHVDDHQARLHNVTDGTTAVLGQSVRSNTDASTNAVVKGVFVIASTKTFELQHQAGSTNAGDGFGEAGGFGTEIYSIVRIQKIK